MKKSILKSYANLLIKTGLNVQPGQTVEILASLDQPEFVKMCVEEAYKAKAKNVKVRWSYQPISKVIINKTKLDVLSSVNEETKVMWETREKELPCMLYLLSDDPDGLNGVNSEKYAKSRQAISKIIKPIRNNMENKYQWCIAGVPGVAWAKKLFPNLSKKQAVEKLWEAILSTSRVTENPNEAWSEHNKDLAKRCDYLNSLHIKLLHYVSVSNNTDFKVGMLENVLWEGGSEKALGSNIIFNPNIPSEECFTSPKKGVIDGVVHSSKPLSYNGQVIDDFSITFKDGKAISWTAKTNENVLKQIIQADETSCYLGECALIPFDSPISNSGILFYETLYDENASCHLALGMGFTNLVKDYEKYTQKELFDMGINDSAIHVDFMIGTRDLSIVAETFDGKTVQIFKDGNWAF